MAEREKKTAVEIEANVTISPECAFFNAERGIAGYVASALDANPSTVMRGPRFMVYEHRPATARAIQQWRAAGATTKTGDLQAAAMIEMRQPARVAIVENRDGDRMWHHANLFRSNMSLDRRYLREEKPPLFSVIVLERPGDAYVESEEAHFSWTDGKYLGVKDGGDLYRQAIVALTDAEHPLKWSRLWPEKTPFLIMDTRITRPDTDEIAFHPVKGSWLFEADATGCFLCGGFPGQYACLDFSTADVGTALLIFPTGCATVGDFSRFGGTVRLSACHRHGEALSFLGNLTANTQQLSRGTIEYAKRECAPKQSK